MKTYKKKDEFPVLMFRVTDPILLDKSKDWGVGNIQKHQSCWVKVACNEYRENVVSNLVAGDENGPKGWVNYNPFEGDPDWVSDFWIKEDVFAAQITDETTVSIRTLDGPMSYDNTNKDGWLVWNVSDLNKSRKDTDDCWFMTNEEFIKQYEETDE